MRPIGRPRHRTAAKFSALALPFVFPLLLLPATPATAARPAHADEPPGRAAAPTGLAPAAAIVAQSRCSDLPEAAEFLSRDREYAGQLNKGLDGALRISVWDLAGRTTGAGRIAVEGEVIRAVLETTGSPGDAPKAPAARCESGRFRETFAALTGPAAGRHYRLQVDQLVLRRTLAEGIEAEIGYAWDCGGPIAEAVRRARSENRSFETSWIDARTLKIVVYATHTGGRQLQPTIELSGRKLDAGYRDVALGGAVLGGEGAVPACVFSNRFTYVVSGATPEMTVSLSAEERESRWFQWLVLAGFAAFFGGGPALMLWRWIRRRKTTAARPPSAS